MTLTSVLVESPVHGTRIKTKDGHSYRDLNGNGQLDPYEDSRLSMEERIDDLLPRMTLAEKAGLMFHAMIEVGPKGNIAETPTSMSARSHRELVRDSLMTHFNILSISDVRQTARWQNAMQSLAAQTRLGIPVTFSSDPRHAFTQNVGAALSAGVYSKWCENLGLAALRDPDLVYRFGQIARAEYTALGIRAALHPTIDLTTDPRWARQFNTFGQSEELTASYVEPYLKAFQGEGGLNGRSVSCMAKHFPGGGAQKDGEDPHFPYGQDQVWPSDNFESHLRPFREAIRLGVSGMMPYYSVPRGLVLDGEAIEEVGFAFNRQIITGLLREQLAFDGVVCCDWAIINKQSTLGHTSEARAWGVEHLSPLERVIKALDAGVDQFGGESTPELVVQAVESGAISEARIDVSVRRLLRVKFGLGLFDDPFVDEEHAVRTVGCDDFRRAGLEAQAKSITILENHHMPSGQSCLPVQPSRRIYAPGVDPDVLKRYATPAADLEHADLALVRLACPWEPRKKYFLEDRYHAGSLEFDPAELEEILAICRKVPTVVDIYLDRPAIMAEIAKEAAALVANYGCSDDALLSVVCGRVAPQGRLPFEIPSSMQAVLDSPEDRAGTKDPLYPFGHGLVLGRT